MSMTDVNLIKYEDVNKKVRAYTHHAFLEAAGVRPFASRFHFDMARAVLEAGGMTREQSVSVLEAVLLLHRGLAIHEDVDSTNDLQRQLRVLAGDYCSSQYYWIISRVGDAELIQALSDAVVRINEAKMTVHRRRSELSPAQYILLQEVIHGDLLYTLAAMYLSHQEDWIKGLHFTVRSYVVREQSELGDGTGPFTLRQAFDWLTEAKGYMEDRTRESMMRPASSFVLDTWHQIRVLLDQQSLAEGNR
ncbi:heptaprenyl diphosphate synthase component 1 [Alicyclobacillus ferrooxydans]|uniref:heptaprenyl diphosphate synthase component 1 n=1 Tax=Alicyclobacillus ferrooxydans TaxID=471514 RepID=UPI0006D530C9|nr:heptaprenyl diphosphate synthase component 1 [Alicyclobacillus ferrooxydans]